MSVVKARGLYKKAANSVSNNATPEAEKANSVSLTVLPVAQIKQTKAEYQREYMRKRRAEAKKAKEVTK